MLDPGELAGELERTEVAMHLVLAALAEENRGLVVDHEDDVAALGHPLVPRWATRIPGIRHHL